MMIQSQSPLISVFQDQQTYAWEILEYQVKLQVTPSVEGRDIAHLLSLYMRGVEKLNSLQDRRELFFKNRMTNLMLKPTVVKSLSSPTKQKQQKKQQLNKDNSNKNIVPVVNLKKQEITVVKPPEQNGLFLNNLAKKKKQMEMRLTYQAEQHSSQALSKLITQHNHKASTLNSKIQQIIDENNRKVEQRIKARKLRTLTARSRSQKAFDQPRQFAIKKNLVQTIQIIQQENEQITKKKRKNPNRKLSLDIKFSTPNTKNNQEKQKIQDDQVKRKKKRRATFSFQINQNNKTQAAKQQLLIRQNHQNEI